MRNPTYTGQCLCGAIKYEADEISPKIAHCHCTMCQKFHGAAFSTFGNAARHAFHWLQGEDLLSTFTADNGTIRKFCQVCGSSLIFESSENSSSIEFSLATLDNSPTIKPDAHIYLDSKVNWLPLDTSKIKSHRQGRP